MAIPKDAVPRTNFQVRRRRYDDTVWLVVHNDWLALDEGSDFVWRGCEASWTVEEIIQRLAADQGLPLADALAVTVHALACFDELGLLAWAGPEGSHGQ